MLVVKTSAGVNTHTSKTIKHILKVIGGKNKDPSRGNLSLCFMGLPSHVGEALNN